MASDVVVSRRELLDRATRRLAAGGLPDARREAFRLWHELAEAHPAEALFQPDTPAAPEFAERLLAAAVRRARGEPFAHVTGRIGFRRLVLRSDRRAMIPRPETEGLVDLLLAKVRTGRIADVGTGTGALALSLAQEGEFDRVIGVDISAEALSLASENRRGAGLTVDLVRGDLCTSLDDGVLDALVSNPPYLSAGEYAALDPAVRDWEPPAALLSDPDGMPATVRLLDQGRRVIRRGGWIALEVDCRRAAGCAARAGELGWDAIAIHADLFGRERYLLARRSPTS